MYLRRATARIGLLVALSSLIGPVVASAQPTTTGTPPPTTVPVPGGGSSPSPFPSVLETPASSTRAPRIGAKAALLADLDTGQVLFSKNPDRRLPIASLTKIMTALLVLTRLDPSDIVTVRPDAAAPRPVPGVSNLGLQPGERISVIDLLYALLLQSANDAAVALAEEMSGSVAAFVEAMDAEARELGARDTMFASPSGLADGGFSTAADLAAITRAAFALPLFEKITSTRFREIPGPGPDGAPRLIQNRNVLLWLYPGAIGVKTGFTSAAGYCVVAVAERDGRRTLAVVLGSAGEPFSDAAALLNYAFYGFEQRSLVRDGKSIGTVPIQGRDVPVVAAAALDVLVPIGTDVSRRVTVKPGLKFPPEPGEEVAHVTVSADADGAVLGRVPLIVASVPAPEQPRPGAWWSRAAGATVRAVSGFLHALFD